MTEQFPMLQRKQPLSYMLTLPLSLFPLQIETFPCIFCHGFAHPPCHHLRWGWVTCAPSATGAKKVSTVGAEQAKEKQEDRSLWKRQGGDAVPSKHHWQRPVWNEDYSHSNAHRTRRTKFSSFCSKPDQWWFRETQKGWTWKHEAVAIFLFWY